jgi:hypothetical protein
MHLAPAEATTWRQADPGAPLGRAATHEPASGARLSSELSDSEGDSTAPPHAASARPKTSANLLILLMTTFQHEGDCPRGLFPPGSFPPGGRRPRGARNCL